jgi:hypothetical protein
MQYRTLGKTGLRVSAIGLGGTGLSSPNVEHATQLAQRALALGVTFFDVARAYGDAEIKLGSVLRGQRAKVVVSTKTNAKTRDDAWRDINESLERLATDYVDNCHLHGLDGGEDFARRLGAGGALEALVQAKEQGLIRHIGCTSHRSDVLIAALDRFDFEMILVPMNMVERQPLAELIPLCRQRNVGVTIMKPIATGLLPGRLAIKWLLNQPIGSIAVGATTLAELEEDALATEGDTTLSAAEQARVQQIKDELEHVRCRICNECAPCPQGIELRWTLGTDVMYDHYRTMGRARFRAFPWSPLIIESQLTRRQQLIERIESCTRCGECDARCPYGLPVMDMLHGMLPVMRDMMVIYRQRAEGRG